MVLGMEADELVYYLVRTVINGACFWQLGLLYGVLGIALIHNIHYYLMYLMFGLVSLTPLDEIFLHDEKNSPNPCNVVGCFFLEKFNFEELKAQIRRQGYQHFRATAKLVRVLGKFYWVAMTPEEIEKFEPTYFLRVDGIHNEEQLAEFMAKEQTKQFELNAPQHKHYFIPDFNEKQSCYIFKIQHCFADGMALINMMYDFQDPDNRCQLPKVKGFPLMQKLMMYLCMPLSIYLTVKKVKQTPNDSSVIKNAKPLSGSKGAAFSEDISLEAVKKKAKQKGCTFNDVTLAITSMSIRKYFNLKGDSQQKKISLAVPFSLAEPLKRPEEVMLRNDFVTITVTLDLSEDFEEALKLVKQRMGSLKKSLVPSGTYFFMKIASMMPSSFSRYVCEGVGQRHTMVYTNVQGPLTPYIMTGKKATKCAFVVSGVGDLAVGITMFSLYKILKVAITADTASIPDPKELIAIYNDTFDKVLADVKDQ